METNEVQIERNHPHKTIHAFIAENRAEIDVRISQLDPPILRFNDFIRELWIRRDTVLSAWAIKEGVKL